MSVDDENKDEDESKDVDCFAKIKCAGEMRQCASSDAFQRKTMRILVRCRWPKCRTLLIEIRDVGTGGIVI